MQRDVAVLPGTVSEASEPRTEMSILLELSSTYYIFLAWQHLAFDPLPEIVLGGLYY